MLVLVMSIEALLLGEANVTGVAPVLLGYLKTDNDNGMGRSEEMSALNGQVHIQAADGRR
jgi:hypothetical protein